MQRPTLRRLVYSGRSVLIKEIRRGSSRSSLPTPQNTNTSNAKADAQTSCVFRKERSHQRNQKRELTLITADTTKHKHKQCKGRRSDVLYIPEGAFSSKKSEEGAHAHHCRHHKTQTQAMQRPTLRRLVYSGRSVLIKEIRRGSSRSSLPTPQNTNTSNAKADAQTSCI